MPFGEIMFRRFIALDISEYYKYHIPCSRHRNNPSKIHLHQSLHRNYDHSNLFR
ncbi:MAG: hypothetical protein QS748_13345 [Candidatus Endonucleobacter bathymodioli]|uniref:Transposase n=1 Tax=Candidatus Endonucleibacter bathymodioli TaxID=539814 RepID=A0AA90NW56_9GAMM|nr:hypothetical protein [Candidatus Endonucleobacter bathymodioli]